MKVDTEAKLQGLQLLPKEFFMFVIAKLRNIEFSFTLTTILPEKKKNAAGAGRSSF